MIRKQSNSQFIEKQKGYSLVELSVALAIVAVILVGALMGSRQIMLTNSVNNQVRESATVVTKIQRQYAKQPNTSGAKIDVLGPLGIWPAERTTSSSVTDATTKVTTTSYKVRGVINGSSEFLFSNDTAYGTLPVNGGFVYTLRQVPVDACAELVTALDTVAFAIYAGVLTADPTTGAAPGTTQVKAPDTSSIDVAKLADGCKPVSGAAVDISVIFRQ